MTLDDARSKARALKSGDTFYLAAEPFEVMSANCGVIEYVRPAHREITGAFHRTSVENLAIAFSRNEAAP